MGEKKYFVHESSYIDDNVEIGEGTKIWHFCHIQSGARIGKNCTLGQNVYIGRDVRIGDDCKIQNNVSVYEGVTLEDGVFCGPSCVFTNDLTPRAREPKGRENFVRTLVKEGATIGANATIVCGNTIGEGAMVAAGAVVTKNVCGGGTGSWRARSGDERKRDERKRVLITSVGGLVGTYLAKQLCRDGQYYLVGTDMTDMVSQREKLSAFYQTADASAAEYINEICKIVRKEQIDIIIPVSSHDMNVYTKEEVREKLLPARMLVMDEGMHCMLHDKRKSGELLNKLGIRTPRIIKENKKLEFPCILKANKSSGSKDVAILENEEDYLYWKDRVEDYAIFEYMQGKEYTVDCLFDMDGRCVGYNLRERVKTNGGGAVISTCIMEERLPQVIKNLESCRRIRGPVNFQYKVIDDEICVFDFNTRLASGGLPLSVEVGFDIPSLLIDLLSGKEVGQWHPKEENRGFTMLRYYEEKYIRK